MKNKIIKEIFEEARNKTNEWANYNLDNSIHYSEDDYWKLFTKNVIGWTIQERDEEIIKMIEECKFKWGRSGKPINSYGNWYAMGFNDCLKELLTKLKGVRHHT